MTTNLPGTDMPIETDLSPAASPAAPATLRSLTWTQLADLGHAAMRAAAQSLRPALLPPVNTALVSPEGFDPFDTDPADVTRSVADLVAAPDGTMRFVHDDDVVASVACGAVLDRQDVAALRPFAGVRVPLDVGSGPVALGGLVRQLLVAGVPVLAADLPLSVYRLLGAELGGIVAEATPSVLRDVDQRERWSVRARRAALLHATAAAGVPSSRPEVTIVVDAGAGHDLDRLAAEVSAQTWQHMQICVTLGADDPDPDELVATISAAGPVVEVIRGSDATDAVSRALSSCTTELATIMTPRLSYQPQHVTDLVLGRGYSRRRVAGVRVRRTYLEPLGLTVYAGPAGERSSDELTAGAVLAAPGELLELGAHRSHGGAVVHTDGSGYAVHDLSVAAVVPRGDTAGLDDALRASERQYAGRPSGDSPATVDPAYSSYFARIASRSA